MEEILLNIDYKDLFHYGIIAIIPAVFKFYANKIVKYKQDLDEKLEIIANLQVNYAIVHDRVEDFIKNHEKREKVIDSQIGDLITSNERRGNKYMALADSIQSKISEQDRKISIIKDGGMIILGDRLHQSMQYFINQGYTTEIAKMNILRMYEQYHLHGGNSFITNMFDEYKELPLVSDIIEKNR